MYAKKMCDTTLHRTLAINFIRRALCRRVCDNETMLGQKRTWMRFEKLSGVMRKYVSTRNHRCNPRRPQTNGLLPAVERMALSARLMPRMPSGTSQLTWHQRAAGGYEGHIVWLLPEGEPFLAAENAQQKHTWVRRERRGIWYGESCLTRISGWSM